MPVSGTARIWSGFLAAGHFYYQEELKNGLHENIHTVVYRPIF